MKQFKRINKLEAKEILSDNQEAMLIDIRDKLDYLEENDPQSFHLSSDNLGDFVMKTDRATPLVVMCYHGISSQRIADYLTTQGFSEVYSLDGGYEAWSD